MNKRPIIELNKNELIDTFLTERQDDIYEWYCDSYPECINSDTDYYDIPEDIIEDYIEDYFDEWLLKNYGIKGEIRMMDKEELDLLETVFTLAIGECAYNDINSIQKLEDKIKTIDNLCKKQKEVIDKTIDYINKHSKDENGNIGINLFSYNSIELLDILNEVSE